tara:strand:+ start:4026 stop:6461 length:2436 start_codon:yes stop_codon:yes gene_type:complete
MNVDQILQQGVAAHNQGNLQEAERLYRGILSSQPLHPDANHNLGVLAVSDNKTATALPLFKVALEANPEIEQFWVSYIDALIKARLLKDAKRFIKKAKKVGFFGENFKALRVQLISAADGILPPQDRIMSLLEHYQNARYSEAEKLALSITEQFPKHQFAWKVLGAVLKQTGRITDSLVASKKSAQLAPEDAEAHSNLGVTLHQLGRLDEAEASLRQATALKWGYADAHNNLSVTLKEQGRLEEAEASCRQAIALKPDYAEAHNNLGTMLKDLGRSEEAESSYSQAIALKPDYAGAYANMALALSGKVFKEPNPEIQTIITSILNHKRYVRPKDISKAAISLLKCEPAIIKASKMHAANELSLSLQQVISDLSDIPLLLKLMSVCPLADLELEAILTDIRSGLLSSLSEIKGSSEVLRFQSALALQCFTNEYLYGQTDNETNALQVLETTVQESLLKGTQPSPKSILCLATYKALHEYEWCELLTVTVNIEEVFTRQVLEPKKETLLKSDIPVLTEITDKVSSKVREQYEENPYPRWISLGLPLQPTSIYQVTKKLDLRILDPKIHNVRNPTILIGGCGTGQHSIDTAAIFENSTVLAVDLSLASLAYAKRQTQELGFRNVKYMQADILDLGKLGSQFDIVESGGVLHHMDDPMMGWRVLTDCLKPGGLMKIGLYSELARQHIVKIREEISQLGIESSNDAMTKFRRDIIGSNEDHHKWMLKISDFYSTSELRDLLFHVQEHRFTLPQIQTCLSALGLRFCGFSTDKIVQNFKLTNTGIGDPYDLDKWNVYEQANPNTFLVMYQFWCQKVA